MARAIHYFKIPASLKGCAPDGVVFLGVQELSPMDELAGAEECGGQATKLAYILPLKAFAAVAGQDGQTGQPLAPRVLERTVEVYQVYDTLHPKLRALLMSAYNEVNQTTKEESENFLASRVVIAG